MKLYYTPGACSLAPHIVLEETGDRFELARVDLAANQQNSAGVLARQSEGARAGAHRRRLGADRSAGDPALHRGAPSRRRAVAVGSARGSALRRVAQLAVVDHSVAFGHVRRAARYASDPRAVEDVAATGKNTCRDLWGAGRRKDRRGAVGDRRTLQRRRSAAAWFTGPGAAGRFLASTWRDDFPHGPRMRAASPRAGGAESGSPAKGLTLPA